MRKRRTTKADVRKGRLLTAVSRAGQVLGIVLRQGRVQYGTADVKFPVVPFAHDGYKPPSMQLVKPWHRLDNPVRMRGHVSTDKVFNWLISISYAISYSVAKDTVTKWCYDCGSAMHFRRRSAFCFACTNDPSHDPFGESR